jgi:hypothetical protein
MTETKTHVVFDRATTNVPIEEDMRDGPFNAVNLTSEASFFAHRSGDESIELECHVDDPCKEEIDVLEIAFHKGKYKRTKFAVDYIDGEDKRLNVGVFASSGTTNNYEKFIFPEKIKGIKGIVITFLGNDDNSPWFGVKAIRLAKHVEGTL